LGCAYINKILLFLFAAVCLCQCGRKNNRVDFVALQEKDFNSSRFTIPVGKVTDTSKRAHDSCMGFSFDVNAVFIKTRDTFFIGNIVNRQSLKVINGIQSLGLTEQQLIPKFSIALVSCYNKSIFDSPLKSTLGEDFRLDIKGASNAVSKELNDAVAAEGASAIEAGPWAYLDMENALKNILDTAKSPSIQRYKNDALDSNNMVLTSVEALTYITFTIHTKQKISKETEALLKTKPFALQQTYFSIQLSFVNDHSFALSLNGFFPVVGKFMKGVAVN
jgi:hypothetical protein